MTYYEIANKLRELCDAPRNEEELKKFEKIKMYNENEYRQSKISYHILNFAKRRFNKETDKFLDKLINEITDVDLLTLELINLKKELIYIKNIILLPFLSMEYQDILLSNYNKALDELNDTLYDNISFIDPNGTYIEALSKVSINNLEV